MNDRWTVRIVTVSLALIGVVGLVGGIFLAADGKDLPEALVAVTSAAVGALGALLARTSVEQP